MSYTYKTEPFEHQRRAFERYRDQIACALFWEMGCGKTKTIIDNAAYLYLSGAIDAMLIVAPNGVHRNWISDEIPAHMPDAVRSRTRSHIYQNPKHKTKWHQKACAALLEYPGFQLLAVNYDTFTTKHGKKFVQDFFKRHGDRVLFVADESARIKTPSAKRTRAVIAAAKHARYRRILTGTPVSNGPFDLYSQIRFLAPDFWKRRGMGTFTAFKTYFGVFEDGYNGRTGQQFKSLMAYRNLDELNKIVDIVGSRVTKDEVLDLPPKLYSKRYVELTKQQREAYVSLAVEYMLELNGEDEITAPLAIVRMLRLQQIVCGYVGTDEGKLLPIEGGNPRLKLLAELADDMPHKAIIWARFQEDVSQICQMLGPKRCVRYDGRVGEKDRVAAKEAFQNGDVQFFVGNPAAAGEGLTLHAARSVIYYSNSFKLQDRLQSEDRAHRIGQEHPVQYYDLIAEETIDEQIVASLRAKKDIASQITGDKLKEWLS